MKPLPAILLAGAPLPSIPSADSDSRLMNSLWVNWRIISLISNSRRFLGKIASKLQCNYCPYVNCYWIQTPLTKRSRQLWPLKKKSSTVCWLMCTWVSNSRIRLVQPRIGWRRRCLCNSQSYRPRRRNSSLLTCIKAETWSTPTWQQKWCSPWCGSSSRTSMNVGPKVRNPVCPSGTATSTSTSTWTPAWSST